MKNLRDYFQYKSFYSVSADTAKSKSYFVESVDLNQDGYKEVIFFGATYPVGSNTTTSPQSGIFYWGIPNYKYSLTSPLNLSLPKTTHPREIAYADFNNDGKLDFFVADHGWDTNPFPGGQNQLILSSPAGWINATSNLPQRLDFTHSTAVGDINNDGFVDIYVGNLYTSSSAYNSSILIGDGTGKFTEATSILPSDLTVKDVLRSTAVQLSDLNNDGWMDLVIGNDGSIHSTKTQSIIYWNDKGTLNSNKLSLIPNGYFGNKNEHILDVQTGDLDGDGIKEIVLLSTQLLPFYDGWSLQILKLNGEKVSEFTTTAFGENIHKMGLPNISTSSPWITFVKLVDINKDGSLDLLFDGIKMGNSIDQSTMPIFYLNDGFAHFSPIFSGDLLKAFPEENIGSPFNSFFNQASVFLGNDGLSWISSYVFDGSIRFRELLPTKHLPKISAITATLGNDIVVGNELDNTLYGLDGSDNITGGAGNDIIDGGKGNDTINGDAGTDSILVSNSVSNYTITKTGTGYTLVDKTGAEGTDALVNIESIKFSDKTINLTVQAKAASAPQADVTRLVELYTAFFNRVPDADGMSFWIDEMKAGKTTNQVADAFYNAGVNYSSLTGFSSTMKNADFINVIYKNVLGRKDGADAGGLSFWEGEITSGRATRGTLVTNILDSAHTFKGDKTWGWVADLLDNKITVAKKFSIDMGLNYNTPEESITKGMAIASAITPTDTSAAVTLIGVTEANFLLV